MADTTDAVRTISVDDRVGPLRIGVLGPLTVHDESGPIHVAGVHRRRLLALLASRPGRAVSVDAIIDGLWGDDPPPTAAKTLQSHVVRLRRSLTESHADLIETVPGGYRLAIGPQAVDAERFERQVLGARAIVATG